LFTTLNVLLAAVLYAQGGTATISGQVKDTTGAVIPNATISAQNTARHSRNQTVMAFPVLV